MILNYGRQWFVKILLLMLRLKHQMAFQIIMPQMYANSPPVLYAAVENGMSIEVENSLEKTMGVAVPMAVPGPVQFAVPAYPPPTFCIKRPRSPNCPVCPPCLCTPCTPSFFSYCSPCHQRCRCRNRDDVPVPLPHEPPSPVPAPAFSMPLPIPLPHGIVVPVHQARGWIDDSSSKPERKGPCGEEKKD